MMVGKWFVLVSHLFSRYISMKGREQSWPFRLPEEGEGVGSRVTEQYKKKCLIKAAYS